MSSLEHTQYQQALRDRRQGIMSELDASATWPEAKADFYADSRILSEDALVTFDTFKDKYPPYGLVNPDGTPYNGSEIRPLRSLAWALRATGRSTVEQAIPSLTSCPYHALLETKLGTLPPPLETYDSNEYGIDTLRNVVAPGAVLNASLFVSLVARMPGLQKLHGSSSDPEAFARNSVSLLREPLAHPQQHAEAFVYSLGNLSEFMTTKFLSDELAQKTTKIEVTTDGQERLAWAIPTENLVLRQDVRVLDRIAGSERDRTNENRTLYSVGTRLGDIAVNEPTFGCPGNKLASAMWQRTVDVFIAESLWDKVPDQMER